MAILNKAGSGRVTAALLGAALLAGCAGGGDSGLTRGERQALGGEMREVFKPAGTSATGGEDAYGRGWRIVLGTVSGPDAMERANEALANLREEANLPEAYVEPQGDGAIIAYGSFDDPESRSAQQALRRIRDIEVRGVVVFGSAFLAPPPSGRDGARPELNLARVGEERGENAVYTLQVAVYESDDRGEAMRAAEQAAVAYRRDGEEAFYYHGPNRSMVTIGVFGPDDYDPNGGVMDQELADLRDRHPHHLYNGQGVRERLAGGEARMQPTRLVRIP